MTTCKKCSEHTFYLTEEICIDCFLGKENMSHPNNERLIEDKIDKKSENNNWFSEWIETKFKERENNDPIEEN